MFWIMVTKFSFFAILSLTPAFVPRVTTNQRHSYGERCWPLKRSSWIWPARSPSVLESGNSWRHFTSGFWWGSKHACRDFGELRLSFFASNFALCRSRKFTAVTKVSLAVLLFQSVWLFHCATTFCWQTGFLQTEKFLLCSHSYRTSPWLVAIYLKLYTFISFLILSYKMVPAMIYLFYLVLLQASFHLIEHEVFP